MSEVAPAQDGVVMEPEQPVAPKIDPKDLPKVRKKE